MLPWRRARSNARSATWSVWSSSRASGSSPASAASCAATAWSRSCNTSNASRSGCTTPPCNLVSWILGVHFRRYPFLFHHQAQLLIFGGEGDLPLQPIHLALEPPRLHPVEGAGQQLIGVRFVQAVGPDLLEHPAIRLVKGVHVVRDHGFENEAVGSVLDQRRLHLLDHPACPGLSRHQKSDEVPFVVAANPIVSCDRRRRETTGGSPLRALRGLDRELAIERVLPYLRDLGHARDVHLAHHPVRGGPQRREQPIERATPSLQGTEQPLPAQDLDLPLQHVHAVAQHVFERLE